ATVRSVRRCKAAMRPHGARTAGSRSCMPTKMLGARRRGVSTIAWRVATVATLAAATSLMAGCATTPPEEDPVVIKLNDLDRRLEKLERVLSNQSLLELSQQVQSLQSEMRSLRGSLEELQHESAQLKSQQR